MTNPLRSPKRAFITEIFASLGDLMPPGRLVRFEGRSPIDDHVQTRRLGSRCPDVTARDRLVDQKSLAVRCDLE
jgi:hypothetical protein